LEGVEGEVDVRAVLVAARRHVPLDEADRMLGQRAAVLARAGPVGVGDLGDDFATLLDRVQDDTDVELLAEGGLDADLDIVEVDENGDVQTVLMRQKRFLVESRLSVRVEQQRLEVPARDSSVRAG